jgi:hypothetical protein
VPRRVTLSRPYRSGFQTHCGRTHVRPRLQDQVADLLRMRVEPGDEPPDLRARLDDVLGVGPSIAPVTSHRIVDVQGYAGTGKSHMLEHARELAEEQGHRLVALAPYAAHVRALHELGVEAKTLASFVVAREKGLDEKTILVVDERGRSRRVRWSRRSSSPRRRRARRTPRRHRADEGRRRGPPIRPSSRRPAADRGSPTGNAQWSSPSTSFFTSTAPKGSRKGESIESASKSTGEGSTGFGRRDLRPP